MKAFALLLLLVGSAICGDMDNISCGGVGTHRGLRIDGCEGPVAFMEAGTQYGCESDVILSSPHQSLSLKIVAYYLGMPILVLDVVLDNSSVQPGVQYTITFNIVPNDVLKGEYMPVEYEIYSTSSGLVEICARFHCCINRIDCL